MALLIEEDGSRYYRIPRVFYPENAITTVMSMVTIRTGAVMGTGMCLLLLLVFTGLYLLLAPLSLYFWRFKSMDEPDCCLLEDSESSAVLQKVVSGILIVVSVAVLVLATVSLMPDWHKSERISINKPPMLIQAYDNALAYSTEQFGKAELIDFNIEFNGTDALISGEPAYVYFIFQDPPGFMPEPNATLSFYSYQSDGDMRVYYSDYQYIQHIQPALNAALVTDLPEIMAILKSDLGIRLTSDISLIRISPVDRSVFWVYNTNECEVEIRYGEQGTQKYIVNIDKKTARQA